jgi:hypothetical protein
MKRDELQKLLNETFGSLDDKQLLALTIYGEARGEVYKGLIAVGSVILERVAHRGWDGDTIKEVCLMPWQFSCFLPNDPNFAGLKNIVSHWDASYRQSKVLQNCYAVASGLMDGTIERTPEIAANHVCQYVTVAWRKQLDERAVNEKTPAKQEEINKKRWWRDMELVVVVGHHGFYA